MYDFTQNRTFGKMLLSVGISKVVGIITYNLFIYHV